MSEEEETKDEAEEKSRIHNLNPKSLPPQIDPIGRTFPVGGFFLQA
ncbi:hypothetical protein ACFL2E_11180 [Thermodesulfobacteriota bacterium]